MGRATAFSIFGLVCLSFGLFLSGVALARPADPPASAAAKTSESVSAQETQKDPVKTNPPAEPPAAFRAALKAAEDQQRTEQGRTYEAELRNLIQSWLEPALLRCANESGSTAVGPFTILVRVGPSGNAEEVLAWPETRIADCVKPKFEAASYPAPPAPSWWVKMPFTFEVKHNEAADSEPPLNAQSAAGIVYGADIAVAVSAPDGWVLDNQSGVSQGIHCVLYPKGSSWRSAPDVMYVNIGNLGSGQTLDAFIDADVKKFKKDWPTTDVGLLAPIRTQSRVTAQVRAFSGGGYANFECVAYAPYGAGVAMYVLTCRTKAGYEKCLEPFRKMVAGSLLAHLRIGGTRETPSSDATGKSVADASAGGAAGNVSPPTTRPARPSLGGYSHWSRFNPGTFVSFRYRMESPGAKQESVKTITLRSVDPDSVHLEYADSPAASASVPGTSAMSRVRTTFDLHYADEPFEGQDPFGGQLSFNASLILSGSQGTLVEEAAEDLDVKGHTVPAVRTKVRFGDLSAQSTVTLWTSGEVPGGVVRFRREIGGAVNIREELMIDDFQITRAEPAEMEKLRASRKPSVIDVSAISYVGARFRMLNAHGDISWDAPESGSYLFVFSSGTRAAGWQPEITKLLALLEEAKRKKRELDEDRQRAVAELAPSDVEKLTPFLKAAEAFLSVQIETLEGVYGILVDIAANPSGNPRPGFSQERLDSFKAEQVEWDQKVKAEMIKLRDVKLKVMRKQ